MRQTVCTARSFENLLRCGKIGEIVDIYAYRVLLKLLTSSGKLQTCFEHELKFNKKSFHQTRGYSFCNVNYSPVPHLYFI